MIAVSFLRVMLHLLQGLLTAAVIFPWINSASRNRCIKKWSSALLAILHIKVELQVQAGAAPVQRALIVANHVSWLDIFVINSQNPCRFVAKADIRSWPALGWLCAQGGTIFIARGKQREVRRVYEGLVSSIEAGERIAFFPEGTTAAQGAVLPFHPNLFEAAIEARVPVQPYAIRYIDEQGELHRAADFIGDMTFVDSMLLIMKTRKMTAQLIMLPSMTTSGAHRRELAQQTRATIAQTLGYTESAEQAA
ncbi:lysophospholipid acyltransferase family protein [Herminiimonas fonticola]|uniref:1-acyl-sn-glycerol-3-phosphate acyltransferase n=1 Tax=Herminiimonas fonticola TaxID=303380 RepID=A0A4V3BWF3_9BURK|nr:1-acyl-sn-glycerol-3-phosphate acyltransferase [Herminiimonas fonticola]RBA25193.1 1-acyl-sn-glycerol-3-phosphate acyltransferase [Herminiimonas fonticola]TDN94308.1 1-acyl-sn-glycerol-3-phosphate acyltransferase [Herminiimonas fonticola]